MSGLSSRAVLSSAAQTLIIYLYLLDSDHVNQLVIATYTVSTFLEMWKVVKVLAIMSAANARRKATTQKKAPKQRPPTPPALEDEQPVVLADVGGSAVEQEQQQPPPRRPDSRADGDENNSASSSSAAESNLMSVRRRRRRDASNARRIELATDRFDQAATHVLYVGLAPLIGGWALYALIHYPHTSWYSWVVSSLADAIYLFGFIAMTPQLFINYKLKSVAHMPWRVMTYKFFNTFVDDAFAILVSMPMHHKIACLRDDAVFVVFLIQRYLYPVDKRRANEYGIAYEAEDELGSAHEHQD